MGKLIGASMRARLSLWMLVFALACGGGAESDPTDAGPDDPCRPDDRVGVCPPRGVFEDPVTVELKAQEETDVIHYTLDGTEPSASSPRYSGPIEIGGDGRGATTLQTLAFHADGSRTITVVHTYVFPQAVLEQPVLPEGMPDTWGFGNDTREGDYEMDSRVFADASERDEAIDALASIPTVSLVLDHADLWATQSGIYMRPSATGPDFERPSSVEVLFPDGTSASTRAGLSIQGGSSTANWKAAKLSLRLKFNGEHGSGGLSADVFPGSGVTGFKNLILDAHLNNTWVHPDADQRARGVYVHDQYMSRLLAGAGRVAIQTRPVHLYLNGIYWGVYDLHERPDHHFASAHLGGQPDDWDVLRHRDTEVVAGDGTAYAEMLALARAGLDDPGRYAEIASYVELDDLIDYMLINFYAGNWDWDHHNWYAIRHRTDGSGFRFISWDAEHVLEDVAEDVTAVNNAGSPSEVWNALLANADFAGRVTARAAELYGSGGLLAGASPADNFTVLTDEMSSPILLEAARWGDNRAPDTPYTRSDWAAHRDSLLTDFFPTRSQTAEAQLP